MSVYLAVEKEGMSLQLEAWFGAPMGIPFVALGGYASQTLVDEVRYDIARQKRPSVLISATDLDPSGEDIHRDFVERVGFFDEVRRIGVTPAQIEKYGLVYDPDAKVERKLRRDTRAQRFIEKYGQLYQYELDGIDPPELERLYRQAIAPWWDEAAYQKVLRQEARQGGQLRKLLLRHT